MDVNATRPTVGIFVRPQTKGSVADHITDYVDAVSDAGGQTRLIYMDDRRPEQILAEVDGLLIPGGSEVDPTLYGDVRKWAEGVHFNRNFDIFELNCIRLAMEISMPMLGICRGHQIMNVAAGGTLYQDVGFQPDRAHQLKVQHRQHRMPSMDGDRALPTHGVRISPTIQGRPTNLARIFPFQYIPVNSLHHQCVAKVAPIFEPVAWAPDNVIEALERKDCRQQWSVQWHPEKLVQVDPIWRGMFHILVHDARQWHALRATHQPRC